MNEMWERTKLSKSPILQLSSAERPANWGQGGRHYAVLMLFHQDEHHEDHLVLIKRTDKVPTHPGQIAFAGGAAEASDGDPVTTALREAHEELGLPSSEVKIIGMTPSVPSLDGGIIIPVAATTTFPRSSLVADEFEVDEIIFSPWTRFRHDVVEKFQFERFGKNITSHLFEIGPHRVWGLTAEMIFRAAFK
jgi:8-oxo-dGTP pyrophosphatase MutT (NUDIX family)